MKKILSMLVVCALLLATLGITASAAAFYDYGELNTRVTVKKSNAVVIDGKISAGEYEEFTGGYTEWYVAENASDYFADAEEMAQTAKFYFSWDGKYLNIAATWNAGSGATQAYPGGYIYSDKTMRDDPSFVHCDDCLGYGPSINIVSGEISPDDEEWSRLYYVVAENSATGEKIHGTYSSQNGQNMNYQASEDDFDFSYEGTWVTCEYRIPIIELSETFKENQGNQMFKADITYQAGVGTDAEVEAGSINTVSWGVRIGQHGYNSDSGNIDKVHATFRLVDEPVPGGDVVVTPTPTPVPTPTPTPTPTPGEDTPVVTPGEDTPVVTPGEDTPVVTPGEDTPVVTPGEDTPVVTPDNDTPVVAPSTGDIMVVAAVVSAISACGVMIAKKRK